MAPNQFEFSTPKCIFVPNFIIWPHLEQLGQTLAVNLRTKAWQLNTESFSCTFWERSFHNQTWNLKNNWLDEGGSDFVKFYQMTKSDCFWAKY